MKGFAVLYAFIFLQSMFLLLLQKNKSISADLTVKSCRAYFELDADVPESNNAPSIIIDYGDESTSLREISNEQLVIMITTRWTVARWTASRRRKECISIKVVRS